MVKLPTQPSTERTWQYTSVETFYLPSPPMVREAPIDAFEPDRFSQKFLQLKGQACYDFVKKHNLLNSLFQIKSAGLLAHLIEQATPQELLELIDGSKIPIGLKFTSHYRGEESERMAEELLAEGDIESLHKQRGSSALFKAMLRGDFEHAQFLLKYGANPNEIRLTPSQAELFRRLRITEPKNRPGWCGLFAMHTQAIYQRTWGHLSNFQNRHLLKQDPLYGNTWNLLNPEQKTELLRKTRCSELEAAFLNDQRSLFSGILLDRLECEGANNVRTWFLKIQKENPEYAKQMLPWIEETFSVPTELHRHKGVPLATLIPDTEPAGDLGAMAWSSMVHQSSLKPATIRGLNLLFDRVTARQPYMGTPNPKKTPQEFKLFFDNMNRALKHIYVELSKRSAAEREATCLGLSESGEYCGSRHFEELNNYLAMLKPELGSGEILEQMGLPAQIDRALYQIRLGILTSLVPRNDPHWHNYFRRELGPILGVLAPGATYFDPLAKPMSSLEKNYNIDRFFRIYTTNKILEELLEQTRLNKISRGLLTQALGEMGAEESWFDVDGLPQREALVKLLKQYGILEVSANARAFSVAP